MLGRKDEWKPEDQDKQVRLIGALAQRLPWIVVLITLLTALVTVIQVFWR